MSKLAYHQREKKRAGSIKKAASHFLIGIYTRNSDEKQDKEEGTIKNQRLRLTEWVETRNNNRFDKFEGEVVEVYEERSLSAKNMNRPILKKLLSDVQKGKINMILVNELSRISRNTRDFNEIWDFLKDHDCKFVSLREDFDTTSAAGEMMLLMIANFAQFERRQTQERVTLSHLSRAKRGLFCGGTIPMGYQVVEDRPGYLEIVPDQAVSIKAAFNAFLKRETLSEAAKLLNGDDGECKAVKIVRTVQGGGRWSRLSYWNVTNLQHILRNTSYIGLRAYVENNEIKHVKAEWEPIIDSEIFDRVQFILDKNLSKKKPLNENRVWPYLLSGLTYCQSCGDVMCGKSAHGRSKKYPYYEHSWASKRGSTHLKELYKCDPHRVSASKVEKAVLKEVEVLLKQESIAESIIKEAEMIYRGLDEKSEVRELKRKIAGYKSRVDGLVERIAELPIDISANQFYETMRKIKVDQERAEVDLRKAAEFDKTAEKMPASLTSYKEYLKLLKTIFGEFSTISPEWKTKLISRLIHRVEIGRDNLKIYFFAGDNKITTGIRSLHQDESPSEFFSDLSNIGMNKSIKSSGTSQSFLHCGGSQTLTVGPSPSLRYLLGPKAMIAKELKEIMIWSPTLSSKSR